MDWTQKLINYTLLLRNKYVNEASSKKYKLRVTPVTRVALGDDYSL